MQTTMNHSDERHNELNIGIKHDTLRKNFEHGGESYERSRGNDTPRKNILEPINY